MGVTRTQVVKFIRKGDPGEKGDKGATLRGPQAWSDCATGYSFQAGKTGEQWKDVVLYNGNYYSCVKSHAKTASNYPGSTTANNNGYWQLGDKIELVATKILLATYALVENLGVTAIDMKDASGNILFQAKDGNVTCKTGTFENVTVKGILQGVTGSFKSLDCINDEGEKVGGIAFGDDGTMHFAGDLYSQGYNNVADRGYRFYSSDIWCRGMFSALHRAVLQVIGSSAYYYPKGLNKPGVQTALVLKTDSNNNTYYEVQCYGQEDDYSGMPIDIVVFDTSNRYSYELIMSNSQRCLIVNANNNYSIYIYSHGVKVEWNGGAVAEVIKMPNFQTPTQSTTSLGRGLFVGAFRDNDW